MLTDPKQMLMPMLLPLLLLLVAGAQRSDAAQITFGSCIPQESAERGFCVHIESCPFLFTILNTDKTTPAQRTLLSRSQCGLDNRREGLVNRILVCCPVSKRAGQLTNVHTAAEEHLPGNVLPGNETCGIHFADRIVGGHNTTLSEFPWMVLLQYKKLFSEDYSFNCGGTLINSRYVLTAGHCLASRRLDMSGTALHAVRLGEWDTNTDPDCVTEKNGQKTCAPGHIDIEVEKLIIHEEYVPNSIDQMNDIALLRLKQSVSYSDYVRPICLGVNGDVRTNLFEGYAMDVAGWGLTEKKVPSPWKLKITVDVWNLKTCQDKYSPYKYKLNDNQLCAGGKANVDTCGGDSGGPLMVAINTGGREVFYVAGITSYGPDPCGLPGWPGVYTRTGAFIDWIQRKLEA
ncbi:GL13652 [Drosophila persimilis]|uniref:CLIP domain-containing serine protease n=1 Tax=Drosophila persimilis TaxID=7234 RepID=B4GP91_DROPE|nr:spaetzle-processing enzyme [Drosophila persimilis]EDW38974.1 GL13652 [Drosophila persimilis]